MLEDWCKTRSSEFNNPRYILIKQQAPFSLNFVRLLQFVSFSILACPPNYVWQRFLEAQFPAYTTASTEKGALAHDVASGKSTGLQDASSRKRLQSEAKTEKSTNRGTKKPAKQLSVKNTAAKFSLDQTIGAAANVSIAKAICHRVPSLTEG